MSKRIEIINASNPLELKQQLEQMVNVGWEIKGVVGYNPNKPDSEPFVILERDSANDPSIDENLYVNEEPLIDQNYTRPEPHRKEISISMGE
jgi:hypothetical protein